MLANRTVAARGCGLLLSLALLHGCSLAPSETAQEQVRLERAGAPYEPLIENRVLPDLPAAPTWKDVLHRALLANGDLEAAYFDWKASIQRIEMASAYPNSNVAIGYSTMFSSEEMKTFDRQTFSAGFDSSMNLSFPTKVVKQGEIALEQAQASGERFRAAKFGLQRRVLTAWADYTLLAERLRVQRGQLTITHLSADAIRARAQVGGAQKDLLKTETMARTAEDEIRNGEAELTAMRAMLNGMLARDLNDPLDPPAAIPEMREIPVSDAAILATAVDLNPELAALAHQVQGREDALELARLQWIPDISPTAMFTGSVSQAIGAAIMLPTNVVEIRGGIREAEAMVRESEAMLRQTRHDRVASLVATLVALRNSERQAIFFETGIVPLSERLLANARQTYAAGSGMYLDILDAQRAVIDARLVVAEARTMREKRLAELEALLGTDIEALGRTTREPNSSTNTAIVTEESVAPHLETRHAH